MEAEILSSKVWVPAVKKNAKFWKRLYLGHKILHGQKHGYNRVACQIWAIKPLLMSNYEFTKIYLFLAKWAKKWKKKHYSWSIRASKWKFYTVTYTSVITLHANFELNSSHRIRNIGLHSLAARIKWLKIPVLVSLQSQN